MQQHSKVINRSKKNWCLMFRQIFTAQVLLSYIYGVWKCCNIAVDRCTFIAKTTARKKML